MPRLFLIDFFISSTNLNIKLFAFAVRIFFTWQGVGPTAQRAAIVAGVELPAYDLCKKHIVQSGLMGDTKETHFL